MQKCTRVREKIFLLTKITVNLDEVYNAQEAYRSNEFSLKKFIRILEGEDETKKRINNFNDYIKINITKSYMVVSLILSSTTRQGKEGIF